jgi:hypothetical protein
MKITKTTRFFNANENKGKPNSKSKSWNKKNQEQEHNMCEQESNNILL